MLRRTIISLLSAVAIGGFLNNSYAGHFECFDNPVFNNHTRQIDAIVSTEWLANHYNDRNLILIDIRSPEKYIENHVQGSFNKPVDQWYVVRNDLLLELPDPSDLRAIIGDLGITSRSKVVIIGQTDGAYDRANPTRVAWTLIYGGISNVAILNGGITQWLAENRYVTTEVFTPVPQVYTGRFNERVIIDKENVCFNLRSSKIIDNRVPEDFFGVSPLMFSEKEGHIKGASNLPTPWMFTETGAFKNADVLNEMAAGVVGRCKDVRVITYCGVGGYGASWWYILSEVLGYQKVRLYDGSIQEWTKDPYAPVEKYTW